MIRFLTGNLLDDDADALVNPVNCVGVAGKGLALAFKDRFPGNFKYYRFKCKDKIIRPGCLQSTVGKNMGKPTYIINFATKDHWEDNSKIEWIESGLNDIKDVIEICKIKSIAIPALGCGLGGLQWEDVKPLIVALSEKLPDVEFRVYEPR